MALNFSVPAVILSQRQSKAGQRETRPEPSYHIGKLLGEGTHGVCFKTNIAGNQRFEGFDRDITRCVAKIGRPLNLSSEQDHPLVPEQAAYAFPHPGIVKMLDSGETKVTSQGEARIVPYAILEELYPHPFELFSRDAVDAATAIDTFYNLLWHLDTIHRGDSSTGRPGFVLGDVKPANCMLRMSSPDGELSVDDVVRRIATGAYEPVWIDLGCVRDNTILRSSGGELKEIMGSPLYLPPESFRINDGGGFAPGRYSEQSEVYALTLIFYELLTGKRPYEHRGIKGDDSLGIIQAVMDKGTNPCDLSLIDRLHISTEATIAIKNIIGEGITAIAADRPIAKQLLLLAKDAFDVKPRLRNEVGEYRYDSGRGLQFEQHIVDRIDAERYLSAHRVT